MPASGIQNEKARTKLSDALEVRDSILPFLIGRSHWEKTNIGQVQIADAGSFEFLYRTPFQREVLRAMRHSHVQKGMLSYVPLEYGLIVWHRHHKVLEIEWDSKENVRVYSYRRRGSWEAELAGAVSGIDSDESNHRES